MAVKPAFGSKMGTGPQGEWGQALLARNVVRMRIREAHADDVGELLTLQRAAFVDEAWLYGTAAVPALLEDLDGLRMRLAESHTIVGLDGDRIVGAVSLRDYRPGGPDVERLMVAPDCRQQGLASQLMNAIEDHARSAAHETIQLIVGDLANQNQKLYKRLGYAITDRFPLDDYPDVILLTMQKTL